MLSCDEGVRLYTVFQIYIMICLHAPNPALVFPSLVPDLLENLYALPTHQHTNRPRPPSSISCIRIVEIGRVKNTPL
jgi:hypothetical protein